MAEIVPDWFYKLPGWKIGAAGEEIFKLAADADAAHKAAQSNLTRKSLPKDLEVVAFKRGFAAGLLAATKEFERWRTIDLIGSGDDEQP